MTNTFNYSMLKNDDDLFVVRSSVESFGLQHVTDKDIVSFYHNFSSFATFDTGLLPLDGTGILAIRSAGPHTQVVTQHAPGMYHLNWGAFEGDAHAKTYYVAQPYRIVIGDFENGNLLGAKMFYSPVPITSPQNILYHVNLPNINCRGYRGNAVGWICLYHKDDWSSLPFNEKVSRFIERCSGVETYNDGNMSETDGPRFYASHSKPTYITDPAQWQAKSEEQGFQWTLDPDLWIPVLVKDIDNQDKHYQDGQNLTLGMAMLGNYQAYYTDKNIPKMYNLISRPDLQLNNANIASFIQKAFALAPNVHTHSPIHNPYDFTVDSRQKNGSETLFKSILEQPTLFDSTFTCDYCEEESDPQYKISTFNGSEYCSGCADEYLVFIESADAYFPIENDSIAWSEPCGSYFHADYDTIMTCFNCNTHYGAIGKNSISTQIVLKNLHPMQNGDHLCTDCFVDFVETSQLEVQKCFDADCQKQVIVSEGWTSVYPKVKTLDFNSFIQSSDNSDETNIPAHYVTFCNTCSQNYHVCPCGLIKNSKTAPLTKCSVSVIEAAGNQFSDVEVFSACDSCVSNEKFEPFNENLIISSLKNDIHKTASGLHYGIDDDSPF